MDREFSENENTTSSDSDITTFEGTENALWKYDSGFYKAYTEDYKTKEQLLKVPGVVSANDYFLPGGRRAWDVVLPAERLNRIRRLLKKCVQ